jgi:dTDP-4-dehydrorhamnose reductase
MDHRFIILGAGGQLGREWVQQLVMFDEQVHAYTYEDLDISDSDALERILDHVQPTVLVNCAAYTKVDQAESEPEQARLINTIVPGRIAGICHDRDILFVHYSTDYVFGGTHDDRLNYPKGFPEDHPGHPINVYGETKWDGERLIQASDCKHLIIRTSWLCGRYGHNFVKTMMRLSTQKDRVQVVNDQFGVPSFADQVVKNTLALIQAQQTGVYHLSSLGMCSWSEFASEIFKQKGSKTAVDAISSSEYPTQARRPEYSLLDCTKASKVDGVSLEPWEMGLKRVREQIQLVEV